MHTYVRTKPRVPLGPGRGGGYVSLIPFHVASASIAIWAQADLMVPLELSEEEAVAAAVANSLLRGVPSPMRRFAAQTRSDLASSVPSPMVSVLSSDSDSEHTLRFGPLSQPQTPGPDVQEVPEPETETNGVNASQTDDADDEKEDSDADNLLSLLDTDDTGPRDIAQYYERAAKRRKKCLVRIPLEQIGFFPQDRTPIEEADFFSPELHPWWKISGRHLHDMVRHMMKTTTEPGLYQHVAVIEVPPEKLQEVRDSNRETCEADPLLPKFSPNIKYVTITRQHFVLAHKLAKEGSRTLYNVRNVPEAKIAWAESDSEGAEIQARGPLCLCYKPSYFLANKLAIASTAMDSASVGMPAMLK